ncbi:alpha/beta fold hydrolase [Phytoactinopolyspora endophytica]|uniref:alpha/beta fold hydrolase n=1 Tax=Phytoactinopolyspora endophytica TaxID=1642495 RepID=UPI00197C56CB|nr:alpha/beta hydrolase [Phytoactinopolyspora endophytica]
MTAPALLHDVVEVPGPWTHRRISANGAQFHVAELGHGPLVLFLHGFPEFWWAWRHQMPKIADAGWRVVAMDLRGYGGSDKPPRGYDPLTFAADITGVIQSIGERQAVLVGHGWGAYGAWTAASFRPAHVRGLAALSMPHPLVLRRHMLKGGIARHGSLLASQVPFVPERRLVADDGIRVEQLLRRWTSPSSPFPDEETGARYSEAMRIWPASHCALEYQRWAVRSLFRSNGRRFSRRLERQPIAAPVLQIHGGADRQHTSQLVASSRHHVAGRHQWLQLENVGHFPHEESPDLVTDTLVEWLRTV